MIATTGALPSALVVCLLATLPARRGTLSL